MSISRCLSMSMLLVFGASFHAQAQDKKFEILVAAYLPNVDTKTRLDSTTLERGTSIGFEDDLNLEETETLPALFLGYHVNPKLSLELAYLDLSRSGSRSITDEIEFGDETFQVNEQVQTKFDVDIYRLALNYDFYETDTWTLASAFGFHITRFDVELAAPERDLSVSADKTAPLPYISFSAQYRFGGRWQVGTTFELLALEAGDIKGSLVNSATGIDYSFTKQWGVGLAYNFYNLTVKSDDLSDDLEGEFEYEYQGPLIYLRYSF